MVQEVSNYNYLPNQAAQVPQQPGQQNPVQHVPTGPIDFSAHNQQIPQQQYPATQYCPYCTPHSHYHQGQQPIQQYPTYAAPQTPQGQYPYANPQAPQQQYIPYGAPQAPQQQYPPIQV